MSYGAQELKEAIILSNITKALLLTHPPTLYGLNYETSYLVFITKIQPGNLILYNESEPITGDMTLSENGIDLKDVLGDIKCALPIGEAFELNNESARQQLTYRVIHSEGNIYILAGLKVTDLNEMTYPVVIDPSISVQSMTLYSGSNDGYIYKTNNNYNTAWTSTTGTIDSASTSIKIGQMKSPYLPPCTIYRGFLYFNTSQIPSNAIIDNAILGLYKVNDDSLTDFNITVQNGQPTYPHSPLQTGDYNKSHYYGSGGTFSSSGFATGYNNLVLNSEGISWIDRAGWTKLCLRSSRDISGTTPTQNEYVTITSNENPTIEHQPRLYIEYRNQSKINNTGTTDIRGYLQFQVQFKEPGTGNWTVELDINETETRMIAHGEQLALDTIFNGLINTHSLTHGSGDYRVYAAFRDPWDTVLIDSDENELLATWEFTVTI